MQEPSTAKNSSLSRAPKNGAQRQCELTEREKCRILTATNPDQRPLPSSTPHPQLRTPVSRRRHPNHHHRRQVASLTWWKLRWHVQLESRSQWRAWTGTRTALSMWRTPCPRTVPVEAPQFVPGYLSRCRTWTEIEAPLHCHTAGTCRCMIKGTTHLSKHNNGHVKNQPQGRHLENFDDLLHSLHCGTRLCCTPASQNSVDELNQEHNHVKEQLELLQDHTGTPATEKLHQADAARPLRRLPSRRRLTTRAPSISSLRQKTTAPTPAGRTSTAPKYFTANRLAGQHEHLVDKVGDSAIVTYGRSPDKKCSSHRSSCLQASPAMWRRTWLATELPRPRHEGQPPRKCCCCWIVHYSQRKIAIFLFVNFLFVNVCFCVTSKEKCHFFSEKRWPSKIGCGFSLGKTHSEKHNGNRRGFHRTKLQQQRQTPDTTSEISSFFLHFLCLHCSLIFIKFQFFQYFQTFLMFLHCLFFFIVIHFSFFFIFIFVFFLNCCQFFWIC